ncbi:MAG: urea carboxylase [Myxococcaceae bacterium]|nr:urea carboxylase [Myxococcaceae bacterium]
MSTRTFSSLLVANRGEIACRIIRAAKLLSIRSVAVYSEADVQSLHVLHADEAIAIGPAAAALSYLDIDKVIAAAHASGAGAVHPGYGFLSENPDFAERCEAEGLSFVGPRPEHIRAFGLKHEARRLASENGVPLLPGTGLLSDLTHALHEAERIGYPVMLKSTAGGGGIGMAVCHDAAELEARFVSVQRLARGNFSHGGVFLEKFVARARHIEVQIFGDGAGSILCLGERDCSSQRRNQKVIEETPAPHLSEAQRAQLREAAIKLGKAVSYRSAGTVEYVFDADSGAFYFLEVNTRLQVEHCITEEVFGVDLVGYMLRLAQGDRSMFEEPAPSARGHAIQVRLYAEDPARNYQPSSGLLTEVSFPSDARVETWVEAGVEVSASYDPMLAKLIVRGSDRQQAVSALQAALAQTRISGIETNLAFLRQIVDSPSFTSGHMVTRSLAELHVEATGIEVLSPGTQTSVQEYPGRLGYWDVGIPPSGPMDALSLRLGNRAVGNPEGCPALEITVAGPTLRFRSAATIALSGAPLPATLDGEPIEPYCPVEVSPGQTLRLGVALDLGTRAYLCVRGGFDIPAYLGSRASFTLGGFGGHGGRALRVGDILHVDPSAAQAGTLQRARIIPGDVRPVLTHAWELGVMVGPHGAPDFFTARDIATFFSSEYSVHHNSARTGVRLIGPKPEWARKDGGEAGLHPSNIHDNAYAIGSVDFTGDMPIILGPDGPSLGGFVCPACVIESELWKVGQLRPGDTVRFVALDYETACQRKLEQERSIASLTTQPPAKPRASMPRGESAREAVVARAEGGARGPSVTYRQAGDRYLLIEYGEMVLDLELRFRVHALMLRLQERAVPGILELTPGIRSLQVHYDCARLSQSALIDLLQRTEADLGDVGNLTVPTRVLRLPLSWDDPATRLAIEKYEKTVRAGAPWTPSNIEFIRRINGLSSEEDVKRIVFDASYLVMGLGDVYLGAPVATPLDPRHRLVTTKYNPARTWTPENAVGIGGAYMCIYGMEGPGGYQFVGRTLQVYNRFRSTPLFEPGRPWLLRFFDQIRFYPVSAEELLEQRRAFLAGRLTLDVSEQTFRSADYRSFLQREESQIARFRVQQRRAFDEERERWLEAGQQDFSAVLPDEPLAGADQAGGSGSRVSAHVPGTVWKVLVSDGQTVSEGDPLVILESMKMEITVSAPVGGKVARVLCREGQSVSAGQALIALEP